MIRIPQNRPVWSYPLTQVVTNRKPLYEERILRLLCLGTKNGGGGEFKKKRENGMGSHYGPQECGTKPLQLYCALEANAHTLAANSRLKSHPREIHELVLSAAKQILLSAHVTLHSNRSMKHAGTPIMRTNTYPVTSSWCVLR